MKKLIITDREIEVEERMSFWIGRKQNPDTL
jgi:hypothetical protein